MEQKCRCKWATNVPEIYARYHDEEWGTPCRDDALLYEMLLLECFQAGLSWLCILKKREAFRAAFDGFDAEKIAVYDDAKIEALLQNKDIIRCRRKIKGAVQNARVYLEIKREYGTFANYLWGFTGGTVIKSDGVNIATTSKLSDDVSADLKRRGMCYVGSITIYSYLQAVGVINDHEENCFRF